MNFDMTFSDEFWLSTLEIMYRYISIESITLKNCPQGVQFVGPSLNNIGSNLGIDFYKENTVVSEFR